MAAEGKAASFGGGVSVSTASGLRLQIAIVGSNAFRAFRRAVAAEDLVNPTGKQGKQVYKTLQAMARKVCVSLLPFGQLSKEKVRQELAREHERDMMMPCA